MHYCNLNLHRTCTNIRNISRKQTIKICNNRVEEVNLIYSCSHNNKRQLLYCASITYTWRTISVGNIGSNIVHQLKNSAYSNIFIKKLNHLLSKALVLLKWKHNLIITMSRGGSLVYLWKSILWLKYFYSMYKTWAIKKLLYNSVSIGFFLIKLSNWWRSVI